MPSDDPSTDEKTYDDHPGYVVVVVKFTNGQSATYRIESSAQNPDFSRMTFDVTTDENSPADGLFFLGSILHEARGAIPRRWDPEECWIHVPARNYFAASWKWYPLQVVRDMESGRTL